MSYVDSFSQPQAKIIILMPDKLQSGLQATDPRDILWQGQARGRWDWRAQLCTLIIRKIRNGWLFDVLPLYSLEWVEATQLVLGSKSNLANTRFNGIRITQILHSLFIFCHTGSSKGATGINSPENCQEPCELR